MLVDNGSSLFLPAHNFVILTIFRQIFLDTCVDTLILEYFFKFLQIISQNCTRISLEITRPHQITQWSYFLLTTQCTEPSMYVTNSKL